MEQKVKKSKDKTSVQKKKSPDSKKVNSDKAHEKNLTDFNEIN